MQEQTPKKTLLKAAKYGDIDLVKQLTESGIRVSVAEVDSDNRSTPTHIAARHGHIEIVQYLVEKSLNVNTRDFDNYTPAHSAAVAGHIKIVKYFLNDVSIDIENYTWLTLLHQAVHGAHIYETFDVIQYLVENGADVNAENNSGETPLFYAAQGAPLKVIKYLVENGANVNHVNRYGETPLIRLVRWLFPNRRDFKEIFDFLVNAGADYEARDTDNNSLLHLAAERKNEYFASKLLELGLNKTSKNNEGETPLEFAKRKNKKVPPKITELLGEVSSSRPCRSSIDRTRTLLANSWCLSLVRKLTGSHQEHAFIIIEGISENKSIAYFIDFVGNPVLPGIGDGKVRIDHHQSELFDDNLIFRCDRRMMDLRRSDQIASSSWSISREAADLLISSIEKSQKSPPKFNILGKKSVFASSTGLVSSTESGHNCFTWAREQIRCLNDPNISVPEDNLMSYVFSRTSHYLIDRVPRQSFWYHHPWALAGIAGAAAVVGGLVILSAGATPTAYYVGPS